ncbi:unnamed protein product [Porites lobata]|uniref:Ig-like domain-containing protein n=1 Tax=Porites lobata TaxID=104759 RepID=A0ABN8NTS1_9CNID|nr:unnamed protein product [Porites lobata]
MNSSYHFLWFLVVVVLEGKYIASIKTGKPIITLPFPVVETVKEHLLSCTTAGTPPIQVKLFKDNNLLASGNSTVNSRLNETATYTCFASNSFGTDSRDFQVTLLGKRITPEVRVAHSAGQSNANSGNEMLLLYFTGKKCLRMPHDKNDVVDFQQGHWLRRKISAKCCQDESRNGSFFCQW